MKFFIALTAAAIIASQVSGVAASVPNLLIFSKTSGYRHDSIPSGISRIKAIATEKKWTYTATDDSSIFTVDKLSTFTTLVFISTTGDFLKTKESDALYTYMVNGGTWMGFLIAADFGDKMPKWYETLVGGQFGSHPCGHGDICSDAQRAKYPPYGNIRPDTVTLTEVPHPATAKLPQTQNRTDEWYAYKTNPSLAGGFYRVIAEVSQTYIDDITPQLLAMTPNHPISWYSYFGINFSKSFYTGMGHTNESWAEPYFIEHLTGALDWLTDADKV